ncbi:site-specific DNA-methyltransferase [Sphingomonas sp. LHG3406-1]|uniref:site-specific DNA-methyltransferase n=1 Tax=Sphingomonas sp. LHG3406-1 TaxID=2804617 RepID=UPI002629F442|nr:site-specific DNA-methyltransferase [Sphingomonas sp. LHG3406-1]
MKAEKNSILPVTRDDPEAQSGDVVAANIATLKELFPTVVRDGQVDFDVLRQLLGDSVEEGAERYGLNWKGKARARAFALTPSLGTLLPAKDDSKDWDTTKNIMVEGDNLEVLKLLRKSYAGKVKLIYIDPPYNTGHDFVYADNYTDSLTNYEALTGQRGEDGARLTSNKKDGGRFHTNWLNMMYPRLMLAKELLREDGVLLVSVGAAELNRTIDILTEVFEADSFIEAISRVMKSGGAKGTYFTPNIDYILVFARSKSELRPFRISISPDQIESYYNKVQSDGPRAGERYGEERLYLPSLDARPNQRYFIEAPDGSLLIPPGKSWPTSLLEGAKVLPKPGDGCWRWTYDTYFEAKSEGRILFKETSSTALVNADGTRARYNIYFKLWLKDQQEKGKVPANMLTGIENRKSSKELSELGIPFDYAKPSELISYLLGLTKTSGDDLVLDFFAGSGTTGHGVMAQNAADGGNRRYILVQLPELLDVTKPEQNTAADFCSKLGKPLNIAELTKERLRRAGDKVQSDNPDAKLDTGFRVYKLATSNLKPWQPGDDLARDLLDNASNVLPGRTEEDLLAELMLKTGIDLALPGETRTIAGRPVHLFGSGTLVVCLADIPAAEARLLGDGIADWLAEVGPPAPTTFFFKDSGFDAGGSRSAEARANLAATLRQRLGDDTIEKMGAI